MNRKTKPIFLGATILANPDFQPPAELIIDQMLGADAAPHVLGRGANR